jgi:hypothetical protein
MIRGAWVANPMDMPRTSHKISLLPAKVQMRIWGTAIRNPHIL